MQYERADRPRRGTGGNALTFTSAYRPTQATYVTALSPG